MRAGVLRRMLAARMTGVALLAAVVLLAAVALLTWTAAAPASAHNRLVGADPADGATVTTTPARITLTFDDTVLELGSSLRVRGPQGAVAVGAVEAVDNTLRASVPGGAPAGRYLIEWRATSSDGHPISGTVTFTSEAASAGEDANASTAPVPTPETRPTPRPELGWVLGLAVVGSAAVTGVVLVRRRSRR